MRSVLIYSASDAPAGPPQALVPYAVCGADHQYLVFRMAAGDVLFAEPAAFVSGSGDLTLSARAVTARGPGGWAALLAPFRWVRQVVARMASGEGIWSQEIRAESDAEVLLGNPHGGQIACVTIGPAPLTMVRGAWIGHTGDVRVGLSGPPGVWASLVTRLGWFWQHATGAGDVFFAANGHAVVRELGAGEGIVVDPRALLAWTGHPRMAPLFRTTFAGAVFGRESYALLQVEGPTHVVIDTAAGSHLPAKRRARQRRQQAEYAEDAPDAPRLRRAG